MLGWSVYSMDCDVFMTANKIGGKKLMTNSFLLTHKLTINGKLQPQYFLCVVRIMRHIYLLL